MLARGTQVGCWLRRAATLAAIGGGVGLAGCSGAHESAHRPSVGLTPGPIAPTTNVPALVGASIDGLMQRLGPSQAVPAGFSDPAMASDSVAAPDSVAAFRTGGLLLLANYNAHTRKVRDLLLLGRYEDSLIAKAALHTNSKDYLIMPVFRAGSANHLLGLRVIALHQTAQL